MLFEECFGDRIQVQLLVIAYYQAKNKHKQQEMNVLLDTVHNLQPVMLFGMSFRRVTDEIDTTFKNAIQECYSGFCSITEPILSRNQVLHLIQFYKSNMSDHYILMKQVLGFHLKENKTKNVHLKESSYYDRLIFYQFLQQTRIRNCKHMPYWALVSAADAYAKGSGEKSIRTTIHSGYSTTISTFLRKTSTWRDEMPTKMKTLLQNKKKFVCCLDNNQKGYPLKFQRGGTSNKFVKVTGTCLRQCITASTEVHSILKHPNLLYINQPIPSPTNMPSFELLYDNNNYISDLGILTSIQHVTNPKANINTILSVENPKNTIVDFSGQRINAYMKVIEVVQQLENLRQSATCYTKYNNSFGFVNHLPISMKNDTTRKIVKYCHSLKPTLLQHTVTKRFQMTHTEIWNPHTKEVVKLIVPPVMLHDEIRTDGYGMALIDLLVHIGILEKTETNGNTRWNACNDYASKTIYLCLDGLSVDRHRCFFRKIVDLPLSFTDEFLQAIEFRKVLTRVIELSGPLHMSFHMLQSIYILYGSLLGVSQKCVEWKKLKPAKVSDNYRLCCSLAFVVYEEITRLLMFKYISSVVPDLLHNIDNADPLIAITLARGMIDFIQHKANTTLDKSLCYICRFWILMNKFKLYYDAQKCGDTLTMEVVENDFCGVFLLLGKNNYYELCLSQVERRYKDASYGELQEIRYNSSCRYRVDTTNNVYTMHVLDELMENVNYWTKLLPLGNDQESWVNHSPNVMVARRCLNFVNNEYRRGLIDFETAIDTDAIPIQNEKENRSYVEPRSIVERSRLFELFIQLFNDELDGKVFNIKQAESKIETLTTKLKPHVSIPIVTPLEDTIDSINQLNFINDDNHCDGHGIERSNDSDQQTINDDRDGDDDENEDIQIEDDDSYNIPMYQRSDCHRLSLLDVIENGKEKMKEMNIATQRKNMKIMTECHDNFLFESFNTILQESNESNNFPFSEIAMLPSRMTQFITEFDSLKKENYSNSIGYIQTFNTIRQR